MAHLTLDRKNDADNAGRSFLVTAERHAFCRLQDTKFLRCDVVVVVRQPGLRPEYHANYYAAFVLDLDGNNLEAVCHLSE